MRFTIRHLSVVLALAATAAPLASAAADQPSAPRAYSVERAQGVPHVVDSLVLRRDSIAVTVDLTKHSTPSKPSKAPAHAPIAMAFAAAAATRRSGRKRATKGTKAEGADARDPRSQLGATAPPDAEPVVMPAAGSPLAKEAEEDQREATNKRRSEVNKQLAKQGQLRGSALAPVLPPGVIAPPDPDESDNIKETGKFDETVEGGRYLHPDGKYRDAEGRVLGKK
jgi:hypothetical protein